MERRLPLSIAAAIAVSGALLVHSSCGGGDDSAGSDASTDRRKDTNFVDRGTDDEAIPDDGGAADVFCTGEGQTTHDFPGYTRVTALDPCCAIDVPNDLSSVPPMSWEPCSTGRPSCQQFKVTWNNPDAPKRFASARRYRANAGPGSLEVAIWHGAKDVEDIVYDLASGSVLKAWRTDRTNSSCLASSAANSESVVPIAFAYGERFRMAVEPRDAGAMLDASFFGLADATLGKVDSIGMYDLSDSTIAMWMGATGAFVLGAPAGPFTRVTDPSHPLIYPLVDDTLVLANSEHANAGYAEVDSVTSDAGVATYVAVANTHVSAPAVVGSTIFWVQASGGANANAPPTTCELWSAPRTTTSPPGGSRTKVADLPSCGAISESFAADGYLALRLGPDKIIAVRGSDGAMRTIDSTPNRHFGAIANVTSTEVWAPEAGEKGNESYLALVRIAYAPW